MLTSFIRRSVRLNCSNCLAAPARPTIQPLEPRRLLDALYPTIPAGMEAMTVGNLTTWSRIDDGGDGALDPADAITALFTDVDGDEVTFKLDGTDGTIAFTTNIDGSIDTLYINTTEPGDGTFTVSIVSSQSGDGRVTIGQLHRDDGGNDADVIVSKINGSLLDFSGDGAFLDGVANAVFGNFTGSAGVAGSVSSLTVDTVNTTGSFLLEGRVDKFFADALNLDTLTVPDLGTLDVNGDGIFDLVLGVNATATTVTKIDILGNAQGAWSSLGTVNVRNARITGDATLTITGSGATPFDFDKLDIRGTSGAALTLDIENLDKLDVFGDLTIGNGSSVNLNLPNFRVRGDILGGDLTVDGDTGKFRVDGAIADTAAFTLNSPDLNVFGSFEGTWTLLDPTKIEARAGMDDISIILTGTTSGKIRVRGDLSTGALIFGAANVSEFRVDGDFSVGASVLSSGAVTNFRTGSYNGSAIIGSANSLKVDNDFNGIFQSTGLVNTVSVKGEATGEMVAEDGFGNMTFDSVANLLLFAGVEDTSGGIPDDFGDFTNSAASINKITVKTTTTWLDLAAPVINSMDLKTMNVEAGKPASITARTVTTAKFLVGATKYNFNAGTLFANDPGVAGLTLTEL